MRKELQYPFDSGFILTKRKSIKRELIKQYELNPQSFIKKRIAILGGSTTHDVKDMLELFLLEQGIIPEFYESEYNQYYQDVMFDNPTLITFKPDLIYIHTSTRNITEWPSSERTEQEIEAMLKGQFSHFLGMWEKIEEAYACPVIQNNFELPFYRILGNRDCWDLSGRVNFVNRMNEKFSQYARNHENFYINDINYISSCYGIQRWADSFCWHMYKYACSISAIPELSFNLSNIIKSIYGKNKKALVLDLDHTLWGGVVGDDGPENIEIGQETSVGQLYTEFQQYIKSYKDLGILLTIDSKNEEENALAGLKRPDSILKLEDFLVIKANWEPKDQNMKEIAKELNIGTESLVFVDDNPAERYIVSNGIPEASVPDIGTPEQYIQRLDRSGFFEVTCFSEDDRRRNAMYEANAARKKQAIRYGDYEEYLKSLEMKAEIRPFSSIYMSRIAQLTNKSNQFNLTTRRCTQMELEELNKNSDYITLYGRLEDKFGDNGVVSVVFGHCDPEQPVYFHIDLWLMSCRVLKRDMEFAMMDELLRLCQERGIKTIFGYYYPTAKNRMVKDFYEQQGFSKESESDNGSTVWKLDLNCCDKSRNRVIKVN